jgi:hypothetical protein
MTDHAGDAPLARRMWRTLEPYHGMIYFAPEAAAEYEAIGLTSGRMGYFASRSAPMGAVTAEVVIATFFNFHPALVHRSIPKAWELASPAEILAARLRGADGGLRGLLGSRLEEPDVAEVAELARRATEACRIEGRPLAAGHLGLDWPDEPHLVLWHAISILREYRGDGHVLALTEAGLSGCEALVLHGASGDVAAEVLQRSRAWSDEEWAEAVEGLRLRGWLDADGTFTEAGRAHRDRVEALTDDLAAAPWQLIGDDACTRLRAVGRELSRAIVAGGTFTRDPTSA